MLMTSDGGENWKPVDTPVKSHLFDIDVLADRQYSVGFKGVLLMAQSKEWLDETEKIPTRSWLKNIVFVDEKRGWTVGSVGVVLRTENGGQSWIQVPQK